MNFVKITATCLPILLFSACQQGNNNNSSLNTTDTVNATTEKTAVQESAPALEEPKYIPVPFEGSVFDLRGEVDAIHSTYTPFDEHGNKINSESEQSSHTYNSTLRLFITSNSTYDNINYDSVGVGKLKIRHNRDDENFHMNFETFLNDKKQVDSVSYNDDYGESDALFHYKYNYDNKGVITYSNAYYWECIGKQTYSYNEAGELVRSYFNGVTEGDSLKITIEYNILERDVKGNWTKRIVSTVSKQYDGENGGNLNYSNEKKGIEERKILYK